MLPKRVAMRCCRNVSRCGAAETYHDAVLTKRIAMWCCRNVSRCGAAVTYHDAVLPKRITMRCCRNVCDSFPEAVFTFVHSWLQSVLPLVTAAIIYRDARPPTPQEYTSQGHNTICIFIKRQPQIIADNTAYDHITRFNVSPAHVALADVPTATPCDLVNGEQQIPLRP
jgi:hypothetical protein